MEQSKEETVPKGKEMLKQKVKEIVSFNASKTKAKSSSLKERRARCFTCKKRGHVFWKCPNKRNKIRNEEQNKMLKPSVTEVEEKLKYPERVHVITDYMVEGSDNGNWDNIWYISSAYKRHMSPTKSLFKRMINRFRMEDVEEKERKFIFSYGVGETTVETKEGSLVIPNVLYTPEITLNVLSIDQLEDQGYIVTYDHNKCSLKYMFDDGRKAVDVQGDSTMTEEDSGSLISKHNQFLDNYFQSIDPKEECLLIKGIEDLKMDKEDVQDYIDDEYLSLNGTLYAMKVNTFPRIVSFLDLIKIDRLVYRNWEVLRKKFIDMLEWFYLVYLKQDVLGDLPPVIGVVKVDLLGLYKLVDNLGGYMNVTFGNKWKKVAQLLGLTQDDEEAVKECYKEYIGMVKIYYEEAQRSKQDEGPKGEVVGNSSGTAHVKDPLGYAGMSVEIGSALEGTPKKTAQFGVKMESNMEDTADEDEQGSTSSSDDFIVIT
ncbi:ARID DNA-binding domain-containing protein [Tanacetum coccineum]